ncbi:S1C family serine protease [Intrasporangium sp. YIM S08009]|uniref:S1C family serine protease n=1 Tax=Intrasporangium zincisolvens TaxID=3080018 RepID=UPI002B05AB8E|nr:trypsin-like peptidase domain-containing protein [Intrasporangium sp. YIM S08009]
MSDEPRRPDPEHPGAPEPGGAPDADRTTVHGSERTGIIDLGDTQQIPDASGAPGATTPGAPAPAVAGARGEESGSDAWFDVFGGDPADAPGVPARADASWGSDRADAAAEAAHRASYAPPVAADEPAAAGTAGASEAAASGDAEAMTSSTPSGYWAAPTGSPVTVPMAPAESDAPDTGPGPAVTTSTTTRRRRRGVLVAAVAGLCLLSAVVGGVAGQLLGDRVSLTSGSTLPAPGVGATARPAGSVANIAATALPSVVTIKVDGGSEGSATGSGFVIDRKGHILTNNHVVSAANGQIDVILSNGDSAKATVVGKDASYDLAVIKIDRTDLTPLTLGASDKVVVGDQVIAVGAPLGLDQTVTTGIVSALNRPVQPGDPGESTYINAIQTDAAINPGNSGGPLLDMAGQVIGVNSAIARVPGTSGSTGGSIGLGFAIPSDQARRTADQLIATGKATHPIIGVKLSRTFSGEGAEVDDSSGAVTSGGPAAKAGVKPGDIIIAFEGKRIRTPDQLIVGIRSRAVGETVTLRVLREGRQTDLQMTLEADPDN